MSLENLEDKPLSKLFFDGLSINSQIENRTELTTSDTVQTSVKLALTLLETVIHRIEQLKLFSINEEATEISTANLKYIITPAICGELTLLLHTPREERSNVLQSAERFLKQFLERCNDYGIGPTSYVEGILKGPNSAKVRNSRDLTAMNAMREAKIAKFKREKELEDRLKHLKSIVGDDEESTDSLDDETVRKYWFSIIEKWISKSTESFDAISQEKELLEYWKNLPNKSDPLATQQPSNRSKTSQPTNFILTRDKVQSAVFGAGYPSLPTMTVEEWYDSHAAAGTLPDQGIHPQNNATGGETRESNNEDDDEELKRQREFDEFKDTHRRGDGNRMNKG